MIIFINNFANLLQLQSPVPVFSDFSGVQDVPAYIIISLESSTELYEKSRTMQLEISAQWVQSVENLTTDPPSDYPEIANRLDSLLQSVFDSFRKYSPLPNQPDSAPRLLQWSSTPPELIAENYKYIAESKLTLYAQF